MSKENGVFEDIVMAVAVGSDEGYTPL